MELKKAMLATALCLLTVGMQAQGNEQYIHKNLLRSMGTLSVGSMPQFSMSNVYVHGNLEYYISNRVSWRGDGYYFLNNLKGPDMLKDNHNVFSGLDYHIPTKNKIDPYIGFQPGIAFGRSIVTHSDESTSYSKMHVSPLISGVAGVNLYATQLFHVFADMRYISGTHIAQEGSLSLNEFRFSFGLGFNLF